MTTQDDQTQYKPHAIQLIALKVLNLSIAANPDLDDPQSQVIQESKFVLTTGHTAYVAEEHKIAIRIAAEIGEDEKDLPYSLNVELIGVFDVDESRFPVMHIGHWAKNNGPMVLYPYLREHVFGLTSRAGFQGALLPLFEIPTFKVSM